MADYGVGATGGTGQVQTSAKPSEALLKRYLREIDRYDKWAANWVRTARKIDEKYAQADRARQEELIRGPEKTFSLLWSNVETLKPAVYAKTPTAVVSRRYKDPDPVGRVCAELLERTSNCSADLYDFDETFQRVRDARLIAGRGTAWVRYEAQFEDISAGPDEAEPEDAGDDEEAAEPEQRIAGEKVCLDFVHWEDFGHNKCRYWSEVWLVWRRVYFTRRQAEDKFGEAVAAKVNYDIEDRDSSDEEGVSGNQACVYEVWDKRRKSVCFVIKTYPEILDDGPPPLDLHGFFPCPRPVYATLPSKSLIPRPDYCEYEDQANQIDNLTRRIDALSRWLSPKAFIPGGGEGAAEVEQMLKAFDDDSIVIPVPGWSAFQQAGGSRMIDWMPLDIIAGALKGCVEVRQQLIQDVYQITGISDILRGETDPNETLGAQELKAQTGSRRVRNVKDDFARFCRDIYRLVCEVIAEHFQPETLAAYTGFRYAPAPAMPQGAPVGPPVPAMQVQMPPQPGLPVPAGQPQQPQPMTFDDQVMERLRNDRIRSYSIDIETDSTVQPDEDAEKQRRIEFAEMFGGFLEKATALFTQAGPMAAPLAPMIAEALKFVTRGFRAGRSLEDAIEKAMDQVVAQFQQIAQQPPKPDPEEIKAQAEQAKNQQQMQITDRKAQQEAAARQQQMAADAEKQQMDMALRREEHAMRMEEMRMTFQLEQARFDRQMELIRAQAAPKPQANGSAEAAA